MTLAVLRVPPRKPQKPPPQRGEYGVTPMGSLNGRRRRDVQCWRDMPLIDQPAPFEVTRDLPLEAFRPSVVPASSLRTPCVIDDKQAIRSSFVVKADRSRRTRMLPNRAASSLRAVLNGSCLAAGYTGGSPKQRQQFKAEWAVKSLGPKSWEQRPSPGKTKYDEMQDNESRFQINRKACSSQVFVRDVTQDLRQLSMQEPVKNLGWTWDKSTTHVDLGENPGSRHLMENTSTLVARAGSQNW